MSWTKREFIQRAYGKNGLGSYNYDLEPEKLQDALMELDSMMALWDSKGISFGYPLPSSPSSSDLDSETNAPDTANTAIFSNLAINLAPDLGKMVSPELTKLGRDSYKALLNFYATVPKQSQAPTILGAGHKNNYCSTFTTEDKNEECL